MQPRERNAYAGNEGGGSIGLDEGRLGKGISDIGVQREFEVSAG